MCWFHSSVHWYSLKEIRSFPIDLSNERNGEKVNQSKKKVRRWIPLDLSSRKNDIRTLNFAKNKFRWLMTRVKNEENSSSMDLTEGVFHSNDQRRRRHWKRSFVDIHRKKNTQLNSRKDLQCSTENIWATIQQSPQWHISSSISIRSVWSLSTGFVSEEKEKVNEFQVLTRESILSSRETINSSSAKHRTMSEESSSMRKQMIFKNLVKYWRSNESRLNWETIFIFNRIEMKIFSYFTSRRLRRWTFFSYSLSRSEKGIRCSRTIDLRWRSKNSTSSSWTEKNNQCPDVKHFQDWQQIEGKSLFFVFVMFSWREFFLFKLKDTNTRKEREEKIFFFFFDEERRLFSSLLWAARSTSRYEQILLEIERIRLRYRSMRMFNSSSFFSMTSSDVRSIICQNYSNKIK